MKRQDLTGWAVDLGGTKTTAAHLQAGEVQGRATKPTDRSLGLDGQLAAMEHLLSDVGYRHGAPLGVAVTGYVSPDGAWSAVNKATLPSIDKAPVADGLNQRFGRASVCNDAMAATWAEYLYGQGEGCTDFVYLTISTGVGGGAVVNGKPLRGARGLAGHFGFTSAPSGAGLCGSGRRATVESVAGGWAIARAADAAGHPGHAAKDVFAKAEGGEAWAIAIIDKAAHAVATLIADIAATIDPGKVVLGGSIGLAPGFHGRVTTHIRAEPPLFHVPVVPSRLDQDGPLLGALAYGAAIQPLG